MSDDGNTEGENGVISGPWFSETPVTKYSSHTDEMATSRVCLSASEVKAITLSAFGPSFNHHFSTCFLENSYYLPSESDVRRLLAASRVSRLAYIDDRFDCDDFALGVKGEFSLYAYKRRKLKNQAICFGVVMGQFKWTEEAVNHAACFFVDQNKTVRLVEPRLPWRKLKNSTEKPPGWINPDEIKFFPVSDSSSCYLLLL